MPFGLQNKDKYSILFIVAVELAYITSQKKKKEMLEAKKDTQKPREGKEKNMGSGYTPSVIIWQFWNKASYLNLISLI